jgi:hypothetical protein
MRGGGLAPMIFKLTLVWEIGQNAVYIDDTHCTREHGKGYAYSFDILGSTLPVVGEI